MYNWQKNVYSKPKYILKELKHTTRENSTVRIRMYLTIKVCLSEPHILFQFSSNDTFISKHAKFRESESWVSHSEVSP